MSKNLFLIVIVSMTLLFTVSIGFASELDLDIKLGDDGLISLGDSSTPNEGFNTMTQKYKIFIVGIAALSAATMVLFFIKHFVSLGVNAGNPSARSEVMKGILLTGVATALLGSVTVLTYMFYNSIK